MELDNQKQKKNITLDDLALMVAKGFEDTATKTDIAGFEGRLDKVEGRLGKVEDKIDKVEVRLTKIEANMVTKDYLDEKLLDLKGDLTLLLRKEDRKLGALLQRLRDKQVLSEAEVREILALEPFPQN